MSNKSISQRDAFLLAETKGLRSQRSTFHLRDLPPVKFKQVFSNIDDIQAQIFAPDPLTGVPRSDLYFALTRDTTPEIAQYIQEHLLSSLPSSSRAQNADDALFAMKSKSESIEAYAERIRNFVKEQNQSKND